MHSAAATPKDNKPRSHLLALPEAVLYTIGRSGGKHARLVCRQLHTAYPPTSLRWPKPQPHVWFRRDDEEPPPPPQLELVDLLQTKGWASQLTHLTVGYTEDLQPALFSAIAAHLPALRSLSCPWLEGPHPPDQPPPALTALTALDLRCAGNFPADDRPAVLLRCTRRMQAFAQLPPLLPCLQALTIGLSALPLPDAAFTRALQQLGGHLTRLHLDEPYGSKLGSQQELAPSLAGIAALAGSLQHLHICDAGEYGPGLHRAVAALTRLTCLEVEGEPFVVEGQVVCLPPCSLLPDLRRLDLDVQLSEDEEVAGYAAWLAEGQASTVLQELRLPCIKDTGDDAWEPMPSDPTPMLEACCHHMGLTRLEACATRPRDEPDMPATGWPAPIGRLTNLRQLHVEMALEELNTTSAWGPLTRLTSLKLTLDIANCELPPETAALEAAMQAGLGQLVALQRVALGLGFPNGFDGTFDVRLLRLRLLGALAALPQLEVLDLTGAWVDGCFGEGGYQGYRDDARGELRALMAGCAGGSLRQVVLPSLHPLALRRVQQVLPGVTVEQTGKTVVSDEVEEADVSDDDLD